MRTVSKEDYETVFVPLLEQVRQEGWHTRFLYELGSDFERFTAGAAWEDAKLGLQSLRLARRLHGAVSGEGRWRPGTWQSGGVVAFASEQSRDRVTTVRFLRCQILKARTKMIMSSWWMLWMVFMFVFLLPPVGYGWGYRRWGPPYPQYIQRRRGQAASAAGPVTFDHHSWGVGGDIVWMVLLIGAFWACLGLWWR